MIELEATMANFESEMEHQRKMYENKLKILEAKIKQAEEDRDQALKQTVKQIDSNNPKVSFCRQLSSFELVIFSGL